MSTTCHAAARQRPEGWLGRQLPLLLALAIIALGSLARLTHYGDVSLVMDEAWRISNLLDAQSLFTQMFTGMNRVDPPVFSLAIYLLAAVWNTEFVLRLVSLIPGLLSLPLAWLVGRQLFSSRWTAAMAVFLTAFSMELMVYSKELKPYSLCAFVHLGLLYAYLRYRDRITPRNTVIFTVLLALSIPFSLHGVFAFPGIFLALLAGTILAGRKKEGMLVLGSAAVLIAIAALSFFLLVGGGDDDQLDYMRGYWGDQICPSDSAWGAATWLAPRYLEHYDDVAFYNRLTPGFIGRNLNRIYPALALVGYILLLFRSRRRFFEAFCLLTMPLVVMALFSIAGQWPFGQLRMNIFVTVYILFPPLFALDEPGRWSDRLKWLAPLAVCALIFIQFPLDWENWAGRRPQGSWQASADGLEHILDTYTDGPQIPLVINHLGQSQFNYYSMYHRSFSALYGEQAHLFTPWRLHTRSSVFYLRGEMLRVCQESRQAAVYLTHYQPGEAMVCRNDYCVEHDAWEGIASYSCLVTSEIYDAARNRNPILSSERFRTRGEGWKQLYLSPELGMGDAGPGTLVVFNFDLLFHSNNKRIKLVFLDENGSGDRFEEPETEYNRPLHADSLESAALVKLTAPVETVRLAILAKNPIDVTISDLEYFVAAADPRENTGGPPAVVDEMCERIGLLRSVSGTDRFWSDHLEGFGWTMGNGVIELEGFDVDPREQVFMLETYGWLPPEVRGEVLEGSLRAYFNKTIRAPRIAIEGDRVARCWFRIPDDIGRIDSITIVTDTWKPVDLGDSDDGRSLGIDVKAIGFPRIDRTAEATP